MFQLLATGRKFTIRHPTKYVEYDGARLQFSGLSLVLKKLQIAFGALCI